MTASPPVAEGGAELLFGEEVGSAVPVSMGTAVEVGTAPLWVGLTGA